MNKSVAVKIISFFIVSGQLQAVPSETLVEKLLIDHVEKSIANAEKGISKINDDILSIPGMSAAKNRHFLNNICNLKNAKYLEIGTWKGSTFISALYGNQNNLLRAIAIDNFSEFGGPRNDFGNNLSTFLQPNTFEFFDVDCFNMNKEKVFGTDKIDIYFYDGGHAQEQHRLAFEYFDTIFNDIFIAIVDDWNCEGIRLGTYEAFRNLNYKIVFEKELFARFNGDTANWWNGLYVAIIQKPKHS